MRGVERWRRAPTTALAELAGVTRLARRAGLAALAVGVLACAAPWPPPSEPSRAGRVERGPDAPPPLTALRSYETRLIESIDAERARRGLAPLRSAACVQAPAERWAERLAAGETLRHQPLKPILRACRAQRAGEIVGSTTSSPESLVRSWMASPTHRRTLLSAAYTHFGIGIAQAPSWRWFAVAGFVAF
jgi:uncharacterized protein YkwD